MNVSQLSFYKSIFISVFFEQQEIKENMFTG